MWWKIYFYVFMVLTIFGMMAYATLPIWTIGVGIEAITSIIGLLGLFAYVYRRKILTATFWKIFFWITVFSWGFDLVYVFTPLEGILPIPQQLQSPFISSGTELVLAVVTTFPVVYAIFRLGQGQKRSPLKDKKVKK